jgi:MTH538 TIR-like domain (DUF1863)
MTDAARSRERSDVCYDAFISYNHRADQSLASALQDALQHLAKPWYRRRAMEVFRDETNLSPSPELFDAIQDALDQSRYYVLMASPGSAASDWVGKEIRYWLATKTAASHRLVLVLTDGELRWDKDHDCYDPDRSTALNPALRHAFASDPLFIDLRDAHKAAFEGASPAGTSGSNTQLRNFRRAYRHRWRRSRHGSAASIPVSSRVRTCASTAARCAWRGERRRASWRSPSRPRTDSSPRAGTPKPRARRP